MKDINSGELSPSEKELLTHCLTKLEPELAQQLDKLYARILDKDTINEMRDTVGLELADKGFRPDWELNEYGAKLENLIDRLGNIYIWPERIKSKRKK